MVKLLSKFLAKPPEEKENKVLNLIKQLRRDYTLYLINTIYLKVFYEIKKKHTKNCWQNCCVLLSRNKLFGETLKLFHFCYGFLLFFMVKLEKFISMKSHKFCDSNWKLWKKFVNYVSFWVKGKVGDLKCEQFST